MCGTCVWLWPACLAGAWFDQMPPSLLSLPKSALLFWHSVSLSLHWKPLSAPLCTSPTAPCTSHTSSWVHCTQTAQSIMGEFCPCSTDTQGHSEIQTGPETLQCHLLQSRQTLWNFQEPIQPIKKLWKNLTWLICTGCCYRKPLLYWNDLSLDSAQTLEASSSFHHFHPA